MLIGTGTEQHSFKFKLQSTQAKEALLQAETIHPAQVGAASAQRAHRLQDLALRILRRALERKGEEGHQPRAIRR